MIINGNDIIALIGLSMTNSSIIELVSILGFDQPVIDEQYEIEQSIDLLDEGSIGVSLIFSEIDGNVIENPCLTQIDFIHDKKVTPPFNILFSDNYKECSEKLTKKAKFQTSYMRELKVWVEENENSTYSLSIRFDTNLDQIKTIVYSIFNKDDKELIGDVYVTNED